MNLSQKTSLFEQLEKTCLTFLSRQLTEEEFRQQVENLKPSLIEREKKNLDYLATQENNIGKEQAGELRLIFIEGIKEYKHAIDTLETYVTDKNKEHIEKGLAIATKADKKIVYYQQKLQQHDIESTEEDFDMQKKPKNMFRNLTHNIYIQTHIQSPYMLVAPAKALTPAIKAAVEKKIAAEQLSRIAIFEGLTVEDLEDIATLVEYKKVPENSVLFKENDIGKEIYIINAGRISIRKSIQREDKKEEELVILGKGSIIGEMAALDGSPRSASAIVVLGDAELFKITVQNFMKLMMKYPGISINLNRIFCKRLREINGKLMENLVGSEE
ncbi:MAG: cyclic nucleotide-binding domain-containing protein [Candidatus Eremiobacterota bacterium]